MRIHGFPSKLLQFARCYFGIREPFEYYSCAACDTLQIVSVLEGEELMRHYPSNYCTFGQVGLDWREHTDLLEALRRPSDLAEALGDASGAREVLGWSPTYRMSDVIKAMVEAEWAGAERL